MVSTPTWQATPDQGEVWRVVEAINLAWANAQWDTLEELFDENCVFAVPGFAQRLKGRAATIGSYKDFIEQSVVHELKELEPAVDVDGDVAVATYRFEITWDMQGKKYVGTGHDLFVFRRANGNWCAVWRTLIPGEEKEL